MKGYISEKVVLNEQVSEKVVLKGQVLEKWSQRGGGGGAISHQGGLLHRNMNRKVSEKVV